MKTTTDALARAIAYLGAVEVAPGRYAYKPHSEAGPWRLLTAGDVFLAERLRENNIGFTGRAMPSWWTPEKRTTTRCKHGDGGGTCNDGVWEVTADLETGAEVSA